MLLLFITEDVHYNDLRMAVAAYYLTSPTSMARGSISISISIERCLGLFFFCLGFTEATGYGYGKSKKEKRKRLVWDLKAIL